MAWTAPCAEAARQRVRAECVHRRSTFASMRNTDSESDMESDADTESVVSMKVPILLFGTQFSQATDSGREAALIIIIMVISKCYFSGELIALS